MPLVDERVELVVVPDGCGQWAEPLVPVQAGRQLLLRQVVRHGGGAVGVRRCAAAMHLYPVYLAQDALAAEGGGVQELAAAALLAAHLQDAAVLAHGLHELLAFVDSQRERLLQVDILARLASGNGDDGVLMVGRGNDYGIYVRAGKQLLVVLVGIHLHLLLALRLVVLPDAAQETVALDVVDVAACQDANVVECHEGAQQVHGLLPEADKAQVHFPVGRLCSRRTCRGRSRRCMDKTCGSSHSRSTQCTHSKEISSFHTVTCFSC